MPCGWSSMGDYRRRCEERKRREAKLRAKGIVPGSSKWMKLMDRRR